MNELGWSYDYYCSNTMNDTHYTELKERLGFVRITFDQSHLKWPILLVHLEHKQWKTLTYVLEGGGYFPIPQILHAYDKGVKIQLHECDYV